MFDGAGCSVGGIGVSAGTFSIGTTAGNSVCFGVHGHRNHDRERVPAGSPSDACASVRATWVLSVEEGAVSNADPATGADEPSSELKNAATIRFASSAVHAGSR